MQSPTKTMCRCWITSEEGSHPNLCLLVMIIETHESLVRSLEFNLYVCVKHLIHAWKKYKDMQVRWTGDQRKTCGNKDTGSFSISVVFNLHCNQVKLFFSHSEYNNTISLQVLKNISHWPFLYLAIYRSAKTINNIYYFIYEKICCQFPQQKHRTACDTAVFFYMTSSTWNNLNILIKSKQRARYMNDT